MLENLLEYYRKSDGATRKKILNTIFAEKLIVINGKFAIPVFTEPIQLIFRISEVLGSRVWKGRGGEREIRRKNKLIMQN